MKRSLLRKLLGGLSLTTAAFIFQACYGTPQDFGIDVFITGRIRSDKSGLPAKGIKVSVTNNPQYVLSGDDGSFSFYTERANECIVLFEDVDADLNGKFTSKDTTLINPAGTVHLDIFLKEN